MSNSLCFSPITSCMKPLINSGLINPNSTTRDVFRSSNKTRFQSLEAKANTNNVQNMKTNSLVCPDCDGNGAVVCSQCLGNGINSVDHYNGRYKAGGLCWLCRGKKDILCGNCNGAGFVGGFMSTSDT